MAGTTDRSGRGAGGQFDLDIVDVGEAGQGGAGLRRDPIALGRGEIGQGQGHDGPLALTAHLGNPAELVERTAAAGIAKGLKHLPQGLVVTGHPGCRSPLRSRS